VGRHGWFTSNSDAQTHAVGTLRPNPWGLHDMHGNVFEWCLDLFAPYPGAEGLPGVPKPTGAHVYRGGAWICPPEVLRSASRHGISPALASYIGFRVALGVPMP
jgi:formylglycine-generating enzyme required for sulfatase activity